LVAVLGLTGLLVAAGAAFAPGAGAPRSAGTRLFDAVVLGAVEGTTEFLPISSTGHLLLSQRALGIARSRAADALVVVIQLGAVVGVLVLYRARVASALRGLGGRDPAGKRLAGNLVVAFLPAVVAGVLLGDWIEEHLFGLAAVAGAWFVGGLALLAAAAWLRTAATAAGRPLEALTAGRALLIGVVQCVALWPGTSRSLATIVGGLLAGLALPAALEFSFLLGALTLGAAAVWTGLRHGVSLLEDGVLGPAVGLAVAAVTAIYAARALVATIGPASLVAFGVYRIVLALAVAALLLGGLLPAT
jgi:undecaprenyl-diphosphatase